MLNDNEVELAKFTIQAFDVHILSCVTLERRCFIKIHEVINVFNQCLVEVQADSGRWHAKQVLQLSRMCRRFLICIQ